MKDSELLFDRKKHIIYPKQYKKTVRRWLRKRYGAKPAEEIWEQTQKNYVAYLNDLPDYGGKKNGHAAAIYGGLLVFALYPALPDQPPVAELQDFMNSMFMGHFKKLGRIFDLNHGWTMRLIDKIFRKSGDRDRRDALKYPDGFINVDAPYDKERQAASYCFTQCPNAEFAKSHNMLRILSLCCNCDFYGISQIHGKLIRRGTCGNSDVCDYLVVGNRNPIADEYETVTDDMGFLVSRKKGK